MSQNGHGRRPSSPVPRPGTFRRPRSAGRGIAEPGRKGSMAVGWFRAVIPLVGHCDRPRPSTTAWMFGVGLLCRVTARTHSRSDRWTEKHTIACFSVHLCVAAPTADGSLASSAPPVTCAARSAAPIGNPSQRHPDAAPRRASPAWTPRAEAKRQRVIPMRAHTRTPASEIMETPPPRGVAGAAA